MGKHASLYIGICVRGNNKLGEIRIPATPRDEAVEYFYNSDFTDDIVDEINKFHFVGNMIKEDFVNRKALQYDPLHTKFGELIVLIRNPSSFHAVAQCSCSR